VTAPGRRLLLAILLATVGVSCDVDLGSDHDPLKLTGQVGSLSFRWVDADPAWSPDGLKIAFVSDRGDRRERDTAWSGARNFDLYMMSPEGRAVRRLTRFPRGKYPWSAERLRWSPDGRRIAFLALHDFGSYNEPFVVLRIVDLDGGRPRTVWSERFTGDDYAWSPDGSKLAMKSDGTLSMLTVDSRRRRRLAVIDDVDVFSWFPGGTRVALFNLDRIAIVDVRNGTMKTVVRLRQPGSDYGALSPDGRKLAFERGYEMYVSNIDGRAQRRITHTPRADLGPAWSPDSSKVAFVSGRDLPEPNWFTTETTVAASDGSSLRRLTSNNDDAEESDVQWSPDGRWLAFTRDGKQYFIRSDGTKERRVANDFAWSPGGDRIVFSCGNGVEHGDHREAPAALFVARTDGSGVRPLTQHKG
jgi:Tol biopolymer transport system component